MTTPEHEKLERIFNAALEKGSPEELKAYLDLACGEDDLLREKISNLLKAHKKAGSFLETPPVNPEVVFEPEVTGTRIGRYKILQMIGEGGFGTVYMAEQEEPVRRKVALKVIKLGMDTKQVIARFEAERQALALMDHPNIARVLDAGATETGRPYFVMELVKGITITEFCDQNKLSTKDRLELIVSVCHAVQHAHQKGIIHRDLKPTNVLVALHENMPVPKIIDFGIAKATSGRLTEKTLFTEFRQFIGTPEYMSPDQAEVSGLDMDTRTDVYSLGALIYVLLTGTTPFDARALRETSYEEIRRIIREVDPPKPSTRLLSMRDTPDEAASAKLRRTEPVSLVRSIRGDLDWIVMKAMEKDRTYRYATAKELADDIERYLRLEPVMAGPPGVTYKFRKFVRRHRAGVLAGTVVVVALLAGLSLAIVGFVQAIDARSEMEIERNAAEDARSLAQEQQERAEASTTEALLQVARSETLSRFLEEMLRSVDPSQALGREMTVRYVLDEAVKRIDEGDLGDQPEVEAALRTTLGETYHALGHYDAAEAHLRAAEAIWSRTFGDNHPETLRTDRALAGLLRAKGKFAEAEALLRETARTQGRVLGEEHPDTLATMNELALALRGPGRFDEAEAIHRQILAIQRRVLGADDEETVISLGHLGADCRALGWTEEAERLLSQALDGCRRILGEDHPSTMEVLNNLGQLREDQGDLNRAGTRYRQAYELYKRILGPDHPRTLIPLSNLLRILRRQGDAEEIRPLIAERIGHLERAAQRSDASTFALHAYSWELLNCEMPEMRDPEGALPVVQRAVELGGGRDANMLETLALAYGMTGDLEKAIETQRRAITVAQSGGLYDPARMQGRLREYLLRSGDLPGAFNVSWEGLAGGLGGWLLPEGLLEPASVPDAELISQSESLMEEGRFIEAAAVLRGCLAMRRKALPRGHWLIADIKSRLGSALAGEGKFVEAEPLLHGSYESLQGNPQVTADYKRRAMERILQLYTSWNKPEEVSEWQHRLGSMDEEDSSGN